MNLNDLKSALTPTEADLAALPAHVRSLCYFLVRDLRPRLEEEAVAFGKLDDQERTYELVAGMGYALAAGIGNGEQKNAFTESVGRLGGRRFFSAGRTPRFEIDGVALLGVALGLSAAGADQAEMKWLSALLLKSETAVKSYEWQVGLVRSAGELLTARNWSAIPSNSLRVAIPYALGLETSSTDREKAWPDATVVASQDEVAQRCAKRAVFDCCASVLAALPVRGATINELVKLLEGVEKSMRRWTFETDKPSSRGAVPRRWEIDHEIHVQNLLWAVLAPIFPDLVDEQYLPSVGHRTPRYDLGIPSLRTIVEVKFLRGKGARACSKLTEEIAADIGLYLRSNTGYDTIIPFIWDEHSQTEEYSKLKTGLESLDGVKKVVILPRPSKMRVSNIDEG